MHVTQNGVAVARTEEEGLVNIIEDVFTTRKQAVQNCKIVNPRANKESNWQRKTLVKHVVSKQ